MLRVTDLRLPIDHDDEALRQAVLARLGIDAGRLRMLHLRRKGVDARKSNVLFTYTVDADVDRESEVGEREGVTVAPDLTYAYPAGLRANSSRRPVVVGAGPCGLFAALLLARMGLKPILLERGRRAVDRVRDVHRFWRDGTLDAHSNVAFGEGGAGTFSDGKLTTQIKDRSNRCRKVLEELVWAGAPEEILYLAKPHIGTDVLVGVVTRLRGTIIECGGEVHFESRVAGLVVRDGAVRGVTLADDRTIEADCVVLAIGHSARDTYEMLLGAGVQIEPKPFSIGVRIEHPQGLIDEAQYGAFAGHPRLGAADYRLVHHCANGRSVYTFCMCPGGEVIASSSEPGGVVTNGMSVYRRNRANANSALLTGVHPADFGGAHALAGVAFQRRWEELAFALGGGDYRAPAQRVGDFVRGVASTGFGAVKPSYTPGVTPCDLRQCLPEYAVEALREALPAFDRKLRGFALPDAVLTGVETRSSSPVRIVRGEDGESVSVRGLYPAGEGAGYAGGIVSAAVDGIRAAEAVAMRSSPPVVL